MSIFQGILNDSDKSHHSYFAHHPLLEDLGIVYYTSGSIYSYFNNNRKLVDDVFGGNSIPDPLMGFGTYLKPPAICEFDTVNKIYTYKENTFLNDPTTGKNFTILSLLLAHENNMSGVTIDEAAKNVVAKIQNSLSGCLTFVPSINLAGQNITVDGQSSSTMTPTIQLYFKNKDIHNNNDRIMTVKGPPIITDVARRPTGGKYSWRKTEDKLGKEIGEYIKPIHGGLDNPSNTITGNLRTCYNKGLGMWESGTQQILARLLTDIDPASDIDVKFFDDVDAIDTSGLYSPESLTYIASFTIGIAMPLSLHGSNPYNFGPNLINTEGKKEKIRVVNRAPISFSKGDIVICSLIESEWIIQRFDAASKKKLNKIGKWSFTKFIVNSDSFLKDQRLYDSCFRDSDVAITAYPTVTYDSKYLSNIDTTKYESYIRNRYYMSLYSGAGSLGVPVSSKLQSTITKYKATNDFNTIAKLNLYTPRNNDTFDVVDASGANSSPLPLLDKYDFEPSKGYTQSSIFDQLGWHMGGNNSNGNLISRTNIEHGRASSELSPVGLPYQDQLPIFWGPVFPDGYSPKETAKLKKADIVIKTTGDSNFFVAAGYGSNILSKTTTENKLSEPLDFMFADETDKLYQLPAEVGNNGSLSGQFTSPIEAIYKLAEYERSKNTNADTYFYFLNSTERFSWLIRDSDSGNVYGLTPYQSNRIQFSPLQLEFATHNYTPIINVISNPQTNYYNKLKNSFKNFFAGGNIPSPDSWGFLNKRSYWFKPKREGARNIPFPYIGLDTYINANDPIGGPNLLPKTDDAGFFSGKEKSNFLGIIAAKNKFYSTGSVTFTTKQYTGLPGNNQGSAGDGGYIQPIPIGGGIVLQTPATAAINRSTPQWGSTFDTYDSFGTTGLHVRIFEQWPDEQTIYDGRYFGVLHFNPIVSEERIDASGSTTFYKNIKYTGPPWNSAGVPRFAVVNVEYEFKADTILSSVDFRVPTYGYPTDKVLDGSIIPVGTYIGKYGTGTNIIANGQEVGSHTSLRQPQYWAINPIRRNQLLTGGGFRYYKTVIGLSKFHAPILGTAGKNFIIGNKVNLEKNVVIEITSTTGEFKILDYGQGFMPSDFITPFTSQSQTRYGYKIVVPNNNTDGEPATYYMEYGSVYDRISYDLGPKELTSGPIRLGLTTQNGGKVETYGSNVTTIDLANPGKYDAFYFFHNDILHTVADRNASPWIPGFAQFMTLEISAN